MKKILLLVLCMFSLCLTHAQSKFGVISYTLPEGWIARESGNDLEIVKKRDENNGCRIILFQQINSVINSEKSFAALWALKTKSGNAVTQKTGSAVKKEEDGWIFFSALKTYTNNGLSYSEGFNTMCDGNTTAIILTEAKGSACLSEIKAILASISIPITETNPKLRAKTRKTKFPYAYR